MKEPNNFDETVPGRPTAAELRAMALRQQQQIDSQHQLLAAKEQRLRFLKAQEARGAAASAEAERLRRLRERVEAQESKLRRLRALRGQVDLQKTYNVTLSNDLDSIRALFSEKEKELSLAVAKVEALTRQLEDLRRDRRGPLNLIPGNGNPQLTTSPAGRELEKLRRELMYRNQLSLQQDAKLHLQREALQQRQAELRSVDQRILELQGRLHKKKASNLLIQQTQQQNGNMQTAPIHQNPMVVHVRSNSQNVYPSQRVVPRGNVVAVEPYNHTPQKSAITAIPSITKNNLNAPQLIQDFALLKLQQGQSSPSSTSSLSGPESDENKIARQKHQEQNLMILKNQTNNNKLHQQQQQQQQQQMQEGDGDGRDDFNAKKKDPKYQTLPYNTKFSNNNVNHSNQNSSNTTNGGLQPRLVNFGKAGSGAVVTSVQQQQQNRMNESDSEKAGENGVVTNGGQATTQTQQQQLMATVHSTPLNLINKSVAIPVSGVASQSQRLQKPVDEIKPAVKPKAMHNYPSANLVIPPRKPISSVAPTSIALAPKVVSHSPKVHKVAPSVNNAILANSSADSDKSRPALPPKPNKNPPSADTETGAPTHFKPPISEPLTSEAGGTSVNTTSTTAPITTTTTSSMPGDNLPIKAKPLTIKKQPLSEQPKLRSFTSNLKPPQYTSRRIEMPPSFLFPEIETVELKGTEVNPSTNSTVDDTDKSVPLSAPEDKSAPATALVMDVTRRKRGCIGENGKVKLARRVSFDPLALLLDASLEGELELVKKTATQVTNPSAANDEGITALHNAICAGHLEIVKFLVEFGCDVNAQDSDGWTPLHCAASCNNLQMVKFLVESGACLFAATLSDHETPAEKCEEDEEGFDGCSEYLYSIQEKLGILNNGEVFAVFSYDANQSDEVGFTVNDKLTILRKGDESEREWWWARDMNEREGYVPRNLLGLYPRIAPSSCGNSE